LRTYTLWDRSAYMRRRPAWRQNPIEMPDPQRLGASVATHHQPQSVGASTARAVEHAYSIRESALRTAAPAASLHAREGEGRGAFPRQSGSGIPNGSGTSP